MFILRFTFSESEFMAMRSTGQAVYHDAVAVPEDLHLVAPA